MTTQNSNGDIVGTLLFAAALICSMLGYLIKKYLKAKEIRGNRNEFIIEGFDPNSPLEFTGFEEVTSSNPLTAIRLNNVEFDATFFIQELSNQDTSKIKFIEFVNVVCNGNFPCRVQLPSLERFYYHEKRELIGNLDLSILFFVKRGFWNLENVWDLGIDITVTYGNSVCLETNHDEKMLVSRFPGPVTGEILNHLQMTPPDADDQIERLSVNGQNLKVSDIPTTLKYLHLENSNMKWEEVEAFLCEQTRKNLSCFILQQNNSTRGITIITKLPKHLERFTLINVQVGVNLEMSRISLEAITFSRCTFESTQDFASIFSTHFHARKVLFFESMGLVPYNLLDAILESRTYWVFLDAHTLRLKQKVNDCSRFRQMLKQYLTEENKVEDASSDDVLQYSTNRTKIVLSKSDRNEWTVRELLRGEKDFLEKKYLGKLESEIQSHRGSPVPKIVTRVDGFVHYNLENLMSHQMYRFEGFKNVDSSLIKRVSLRNITINAEDLCNIWLDLTNCERLDIDGVDVSSLIPPDSNSTGTIKYDNEFEPRTLTSFALMHLPPKLDTVSVRNSTVDQIEFISLESLTFFNCSLGAQTFLDFDSYFSVYQIVITCDGRGADGNYFTTVNYDILKSILRTEPYIILISGFDHTSSESAIKSVRELGNDFVLLKDEEESWKGVGINPEEKDELVYHALGGEILTEHINRLLNNRPSGRVFRNLNILT